MQRSKKGIKHMFILVLVALLTAGLLGCTTLEVAGAAQTAGQSAGAPAGSNAVRPPQNADDDNPLQPGEGDVTRTYLATFVTNQGSAVNEMRTARIETEPVTTRDGFIFVGWYLNDDFSDHRVEFPYTLTDDTVFYAKWVTTATQIITTGEQLVALSRNVDGWVGNYALGGDIDLSGVEWQPIGDRQNPFSGTFDGGGYSVRNLSLQPESEDEEYNFISVGLFGHVTGSISNVNVPGYNILLDGGFSRFYLGGLAGWLEEGSVTNCSAQGNIVNPKLEYEGDIWDDFFGSYAEPTEHAYFGGLIGRVDSGTISRCRVTGGAITSETVTDTTYGGGLIGYNEAGTVENSFSQMQVKARMAGGLIGYNNGTVRTCFAAGNVQGSLAYPAVAGGLAGYNDTMGAISRSYATGTVSARTAGGLVGVNMFDYLDPVGGSVLNCFATGNVTAAEYGGGLIGRAEAQLPVAGQSSYHSSINASYYFIGYCFAYGDVMVDVRDVYYVEDDGSGQTQGTQGVYHSVFAGGLIGHATEPLLRSVVATGDVTARSTRPVSGTDTQIYNSVYASNLVGQSTALLPTGRNLYGLDTQLVMRNDSVWRGFNSAPTQSADVLSGSSFLTSTMGFDPNVWNLNNVDFARGRYPTLM